MKNIALANSILQSLWGFGVREVVLCAGARNAPFVSVLAQPGPLRVHSFFEERSAAFFALGRMQATGRPVAVVTTSGTAAAELLPAAIESDYQGLPLVMVTADRPRSYRGSGAPQTMDQVGLYSHYVERSWDIEGQCDLGFEASGRRPLHFNVCFDEPLIDEESGEFTPTVMDHAHSAGVANPKMPKCEMARPLIVVTALPKVFGPSVQKWLLQAARPVYLEAPSQLRGLAELQDLEWTGGDNALKLNDFDGVIRIGGVPTLRLWRDLEKSQLPVLHFSHLPFSGLPRVPEVFPLHLLSDFSPRFDPWRGQDSSRALGSKLKNLLAEFPLSEPAWVQWLSQQIRPGSRLFLGNSLPVREWDLAADRDSRPEIFVNRGVNGIDGLISTFLGTASAEKSNWALIGDLTALYDLSGPWAARGLGIQDLNLVIINNGGGKIFKNIFHNPLFENPHGLGFAHWSKMWGWDHQRLEYPLTLHPASRPRVLEILPHEEQTEAFWKEFL